MDIKRSLDRTKKIDESIYYAIAIESNKMIFYLKVPIPEDEFENYKFVRDLSDARLHASPVLLLELATLIRSNKDEFDKEFLSQIENAFIVGIDIIVFKQESDWAQDLV